MGETVHTDRRLASRILQGDAEAFRGLFDSFFPRLYRFALARLDGDVDAATDVVQQTFCKALEHLDGYRGEAALYTWFCQVCRNTIVDQQRASHREEQEIVPLEDHPHVRAILENLAAPARDQPELRRWRQELGRLVQATVDTLPEHYSTVLELKYIDELSVQDIATQLNIGTKAAESLLTRARQAFRSAFSAIADAPDAFHPPQETYGQG